MGLVQVSAETRIRLSGTAIARAYARTHEWLYRLSGGRFGAHIGAEGAEELAAHEKQLDLLQKAKQELAAR